MPKAPIRFAMTMLFPATHLATTMYVVLPSASTKIPVSNVGCAAWVVISSTKEPKFAGFSIWEQVIRPLQDEGQSIGESGSWQKKSSHEEDGFQRPSSWGSFSASGLQTLFCATTKANTVKLRATPQSKSFSPALDPRPKELFECVFGNEAFVGVSTSFNLAITKSANQLIKVGRSQRLCCVWLAMTICQKFRLFQAWRRGYGTSHYPRAGRFLETRPATGTWI